VVTGKPNKLVVFLAVGPVEGTFYQVCADTDRGLETLLVADIELEGDAEIREIIQDYRVQGVPVELDRFAARWWSDLL
jgi:hypothetical protein